MNKTVAQMNTPQKGRKQRKKRKRKGVARSGKKKKDTQLNVNLR